MKSKPCNNCAMPIDSEEISEYCYNCRPKFICSECNMESLEPLRYKDKSFKCIDCIEGFTFDYEEEFD